MYYVYESSDEKIMSVRGHQYMFSRENKQRGYCFFFTKPSTQSLSEFYMWPSVLTLKTPKKVAVVAKNVTLDIRKRPALALIAASAVKQMRLPVRPKGQPQK